jgi:gluconolactonase
LSTHDHDESVLYINDTTAGQVRAYDVAADGSLSGRRLVHEHKGRGWPHEGNFDGMECDELGNIWVTGPGGVWVIAPEGERLGVLETPKSAAACAGAPLTCTRSS